MYLIFGYAKGMQRKFSKVSTAGYKTQFLQARKIKGKRSQSISFSIRIKEQKLQASRSLRETDLVSCIYLAQYRSLLRIWSHLLKKSLLENFIFRAVS